MTNFTMTLKSCMITQLLGWFVVQIRLSIKMVIILLPNGNNPGVSRILLRIFNNSLGE